MDLDINLVFYLQYHASVAESLCWLLFSYHYRSVSDVTTVTLASQDNMAFCSLSGGTADVLV